MEKSPPKKATAKSKKAESRGRRAHKNSESSGNGSESEIFGSFQALTAEEWQNSYHKTQGDTIVEEDEGKSSDNEILEVSADKSSSKANETVNLDDSSASKRKSLNTSKADSRNASFVQVELNNTSRKSKGGKSDSMNLSMDSRALVESSSKIPRLVLQRSNSYTSIDEKQDKSSKLSVSYNVILSDSMLLDQEAEDADSESETEPVNSSMKKLLHNSMKNTSNLEKIEENGSSSSDEDFVLGTQQEVGRKRFSPGKHVISTDSDVSSPRKSLSKSSHKQQTEEEESEESSSPAKTPRKSLNKSQQEDSEEELTSSPPKSRRESLNKSLKSPKVASQQEEESPLKSGKSFNKSQTTSEDQESPESNSKTPAKSPRKSLDKSTKADTPAKTPRKSLSLNKSQDEQEASSSRKSLKKEADSPKVTTTPKNHLQLPPEDNALDRSVDPQRSPRKSMNRSVVNYNSEQLAMDNEKPSKLSRLEAGTVDLGDSGDEQNVISLLGESKVQQRLQKMMNGGTSEEESDVEETAKLQLSEEQDVSMHDKTHSAKKLQRQQRTKDNSMEKSVSSEGEQESSHHHKVSSFLDNEASEGNNGEKSLDSDIEREYNLCGKDLTGTYEDDNVPGDDCRDSESEHSDSHDDGSDLEDFINDNEEEEEEESSSASSDSEAEVERLKERLGFNKSKSEVEKEPSKRKSSIRFEEPVVEKAANTSLAKTPKAQKRNSIVEDKENSLRELQEEELAKKPTIRSNVVVQEKFMTPEKLAPVSILSKLKRTEGQNQSLAMPIINSPTTKYLQVKFFFYYCL